MTPDISAVHDRFSNNTFQFDTRAVALNVGFIIQVGIATIIIIGVIAGMTSVINSQQDRAVEHQTTIIGEQTAASIMAADRAADSGARTNITLNRQLPEDVVGTPYIVRLIDDPSGAYVLVTIVGQEEQEEIPVNTDADIDESSVAGGSNMQIVVEHDPATGDAEIRIEKREESTLP